MEPTLVLETKSFALRLYSLLRDLDPSRWGSVRKQTLKTRIVELEAEVHALYDQMQGVFHSLEDGSHKEYPLTALRETLKQVGQLLTQLKAVQLDDHLSYVSLYSLSKRLQKAYQRLSVMMEACQTPIPHLRPTNLTRSVFHAANGVSILAMIASVPSFGWMFWIALAFLVFCVATETAKRFSPEVKAKVMRVFAPIAHPHEYDKINSATWYGVALLLLSLMPLPLGIVAVAVLGFADPAAALIGRKYGKIPMPGNRTLEGSLTFFVVGTLAASISLSLMHPLPLGVNLLVSAAAALTGALGEYLGKYPDDNLSIPLASAGGAALALMGLGLL
ncbi:MAG: diacylglycerol/polyprenol kinase family protein [Candidatus Sericytochromatia bacterium]